MSYRIIIAPSALAALKKITDRRIRERIVAAIGNLAEDPELQGKPLLGELAGFRSLRAAGQRYRVIYTVERRRVSVYIVIVGLRKEGSRADVYALAEKLLKVGLLKE